MGILQMIFQLLALLLLCYALYRVVHGILEHISFPTGLLILLMRGHWAVLGVCLLLVIANCAVRTVSVVRTIESDAGDIAIHDNRLTTSRAVLFMIMALEILLWAIVPMVKLPAGSELPGSKVYPQSLTIRYVGSNFSRLE